MHATTEQHEVSIDICLTCSKYLLCTNPYINMTQLSENKLEIRLQQFLNRNQAGETEH